MKTLAIIAVLLLVLWWCLLTWWAISSHRKRVRLAANWTAENEAEYQKLEADTPRFQIRGWNCVIIAPFLVPSFLIFLPCYVFEWLVPDPFKKRDESA